MRIIALLWASYLPIFYGIDSLSVALRSDVQALPASYYLGHALPPLSLLGFSFWARGRWARRLLPLLLVMLAVMPLVITPLVIGPPRPGPLIASSGLLVIRMLPLLYTALVLIAWHYRWPHVVAFSVGTGLLSAAPGLLWGSLLMPTVAMIHTLAFLGSGYAICLVAERLRTQSRALEQANSQLRHYASVLERLATTRERNRMARELHDTLAHTLTALAVQMETAKAYTQVDAEITRQLLERGLKTARQGVDETRRVLKALRASPLDDLGLQLSIRELATAAAEAAGLRLELRLGNELPPLPLHIEQGVYRIAQEALANVTHHAGATRLRLILECEDAILRLVITDDGRGFDERAVATDGHFGLAGMREWAGLTGGQIGITSQPGRGATVQFMIGV